MSIVPGTLRWGLLGTAHINRRLIPAMRATRRSMVAAVASRDRRSRAVLRHRVADSGRARRLRQAAARSGDRRRSTFRCPTRCTSSGRCARSTPASTSCARSRWRATAEDVDRVRGGRARPPARRRRSVHVSARADDGAHPRTDRRQRRRPAPASPPASRSRRAATNDVRLDAALGGGSLWDVGCYAVGIARLVAGAEPVEAFGYATYG